MIRCKQLVLRSVAVFVLDEADKLLEGAMCAQVAELYEALPRRKQVPALGISQTCLLQTVSAALVCPCCAQGHS
jgi:superfamily II DNA/RNA helicase